MTIEDIPHSETADGLWMVDKYTLATHTQRLILEARIEELKSDKYWENRNDRISTLTKELEELESQ